MQKMKEEQKQVGALGGGPGGARGRLNIGGQQFDEEELKADLGDKYYELGDMVNNLKNNLKRVAEQSKQAIPLNAKI
jgi:hypothetical protein